LTIYQKAVNLF